MVVNLAKSRGHFVGESASDNHAIGLARARPKNDTKAIEVVARSTGVHHFDGAASEAESHGPDGPTTGPVQEVIDLGDHVLSRLRETGGSAGGGRRRRASVCGWGGRRGERRDGGVNSEGTL